MVVHPVSWRIGSFCVALLMLLFVFATSDAQICGTHGAQTPGECTPAKNCPTLLNTFKPVDLPIFIEQHGCGVEPETGDVLVCCPRVIAASGGISSDASRPSQNCGSKQVNGGALWPFVVGLGYMVPGENRMAVICNGVLINPEWVLTDPSCFSEQVITTAFFGIGRAEHDKIIRIPVAHTRRPTDYDSTRDLNAIGLVKLSVNVTASDDIQVVCMPSGPDYDPVSPRFVLYIGKIDDGSLAGGFEVRSFWKQKVSLEACRTSPGIAVFPSGAHLCTNGLQACNVPMARPLLVSLDPKGGGYTIVGVGGLTADRCTSDVTTFTAISKFLPFINRIVNPATPVDQLFITASNLLQFLVNREDVDTCGRRTVGAGVQFPFVVSLGKGSRVQSGGTGNEGSWTYSSFCSGVLLAPLWVLTDARCIQNNAADHVATSYTRNPAQTKYAKVAFTQTPPGYSPLRDHNTVALVKLDAPLNFSVDTQPVCLARPSSFDNSSSLMALSTGYGFNQAGELTLDTGREPVGRVNNDDCIASRYVTFDAQAGPYICTSNIKACSFLANPPIIAEEDVNSGTFTVVGVGGENANYCKGDFMAHVRVRPHVPWITSAVFPDGDPNNPDLPTLISTFNNNFQPNTPLQNRPPNQTGGASSQKRGNTPESNVSPGVVANFSPGPASNDHQAASLVSNGAPAFAPSSTSISSPSKIIVFPT